MRILTISLLATSLALVAPACGKKPEARQPVAASAATTAPAPPPAQGSAGTALPAAPSPTALPEAEVALQEAKALLHPKSAEEVVKCGMAALRALAPAKLAADDPSAFAEHEEALPVATQALRNAIDWMSQPEKPAEDRTQIEGVLGAEVTTRFATGAPAMQKFLSDSACMLLVTSSERMRAADAVLPHIDQEAPLRSAWNCLLQVGPVVIASRTGQPFEPKSTLDRQITVFRAMKQSRQQAVVLGFWTGPEVQGNAKVTAAVVSSFDKLTGEDRERALIVLSAVGDKSALQAIVKKLEAAADSADSNLLSSARTRLSAIQ